MRVLSRTLTAMAITASTLTITTAAASGSSAPRATLVFTLDPSTHGNPEGVAVDRRTGDFFTGTLGDGTIYRGNLHNRTVTPFIVGAPGRAAAGMKVVHGLLYVAGGSSKKINVYDIATGALQASIDAPNAGLLNDLVVTDHGDLWVTDSFVPVLWHVTAAQLTAGTGTATGLSVADTISFTPGAFNLNGIVALDDDLLIVNNSATGELWRIALDDDHAHITKLDAPPLPGADGMIIDRGHLVVVQGGAPQLAFLTLTNRARRATLDTTRTDPALLAPSAVARDKNRYIVVNVDFVLNRTPYTIAALAR